MVTILESAESWTKKYGVETKEGVCSCGKNIIANIPFAEGKLRGFVSKDHGCGFEKTLVVFKVSKEEFFGK